MMLWVTKKENLQDILDAKIKIYNFSFNVEFGIDLDIEGKIKAVNLLKEELKQFNENFRITNTYQGALVESDSGNLITYIKLKY
jgi:hypothetical protein